MFILAHRGFWKEESEQNKLIAFGQSFESGFGIETDIRDCNGCLVISHNPPDKNSLPAEELFHLYEKSGRNLPLALNIKADGLQEKLSGLLNKYNIKNYFVFDMSVPDTIGYIRKKCRFFTRQSEYEREPIFYEEACGVWLDEFNGHWINSKVIQSHLDNLKKVCIVSPELHKRSYLKVWDDYLMLSRSKVNDKLMLCTDFPEEARRFFNGQDKSNSI